jgi:hypothetical protein
MRVVRREVDASAAEGPRAMVRGWPTSRPVSPEELAAATIALSRRPRGAGVRRKLFVPNNAALYNGAFSGFTSGCNQARTIGSATTGLVAQAVLFAQAVDTLIPTDGSLNQSKVDLLTSLVANVFGDQYPVGLEESDYAATAEEVVALYDEAVLLLASIPPVGGGPFEQPGGVGTVIEPFDESAAFQVSGGSASGTQSQALGPGSATLDPNDFALSGGGTGTGSGAGNNVASGGGFAGSATGGDVCFGPNTAQGGYSSCVGGSSNYCYQENDGCFGGTTNVADGGVCVGGARNRAAGGVCVGGEGNVATTDSVCLGGFNQTANAQSSVTVGQGTFSFAGLHDGAACFNSATPMSNAGICVGYGCAGSIPTETNSSVVLSNGINGAESIQIPVGSAVRLHVQAIAQGESGALCAAWDYVLLVNCSSGGIAAIVGTTDPGTYIPKISSGGDRATWTLTPSVDGSDNSVALTFANGSSPPSTATGCDCRIDTIGG